MPERTENLVFCKGPDKGRRETESRDKKEEKNKGRGLKERCTLASPPMIKIEGEVVYHRECEIAKWITENQFLHSEESAGA